MDILQYVFRWIALFLIFIMAVLLCIAIGLAFGVQPDNHYGYYSVSQVCYGDFHDHRLEVF